MKVLQINHQVKAVTDTCETCGGPHSYNDFPATVGQTQNIYATGAYNQGGNSYQPQERLNQNRNQGNNHGIPQGNNQERNEFFQGASHGQNPPLAYQAPAYQAPGYQALVHQPLIPQPMDECLALADLGASINLIPLPVWNKLSLLELTPTLMTLELANASISQPIGVAEDVFVKVGKFHFLTDFIVVDFNADPRVRLILGRSFLKTGKALIDVYEGELTLHVGKEAITFNLDQTSRYSACYNDVMANRIDVIDMAYEENSDFLLEEVDAFLALEDDSTSPEVDYSYYNMEGRFFVTPLVVKKTLGHNHSVSSKHS
nr:reverse transcriptase domain-containing protein [Tanacetum cinerariifolium]